MTLNERTACEYLAAIQSLLDRLPHNTAPYPFSVTKVRQSEAKTPRPYWWVHVHVRIPGDAEFTLDSEKHDLRDALRGIHHRLRRINRHMADARAANQKANVYGDYLE